MQLAHRHADVVEPVLDQVLRLGREVAEGVVAPVVVQPLLQQVPVLQVGVDRQELDGGDAEPPQVGDHVGMAEGGEGPVGRRPHLVEELGQPLHVRLVDHRLRPGRARAAVVPPGEAVVDHHRLGHGRGAVAAIEGEVGAGRGDAIAEQGVGPAHIAAHGAGVRVQQQLVGIEPVPLLRSVGTVGPVAVEHPRKAVRQVAVPDLVGPFGQRITADLTAASRIEQAEFDLLRMGGEHREVHALPVPGGAERIG